MVYLEIKVTKKKKKRNKGNKNLTKIVTGKSDKYISLLHKLALYINRKECKSL